VARSVRVARPGRLGPPQDRVGDRLDGGRGDTRLVGEQHHGDLGVRVAADGKDPGPKRGRLAVEVVRVDDHLEVPAPGGGGRDGVTVVADDHEDAADLRGVRRGDDVADEREPVHLGELLGGAEPLAAAGGEHDGDDTAPVRLPAPRPELTVSDHHRPSDDHRPASEPSPEARRTAVVVTASDGVAYGHRTDDSGRAVEELLTGAGFTVASREVVPDEREQIAELLRRLADAGGVALIVITGGTGFGPRDVTPEATEDAIDRRAPGLAEAMRASGRASTPMADLSRGVCGVRGSTLVVDLPGSPRGAVESLSAVLELLPHALDLLAGETRRHPEGHGDPDAG
jgi:molybdopterin adenylyltransferase